MQANDRRLPQARSEALLVQELPDELLVYDLERHRSHCLNQTAAWIWRHCDGKTTVPQMAALLQQELNLPADEDVVWLALARLSRAHLLVERVALPVSTRHVSRRALVRRLATVGGLAVVTSIIAPEAAHAATPCTVTAQCGNMVERCCCQKTNPQGTVLSRDCKNRTACVSGGGNIEQCIA